jgi:hypothetical protein
MRLAENEILGILAFDPDYWHKFPDTRHWYSKLTRRNYASFINKGFS